MGIWYLYMAMLIIKRLIIGGRLWDVDSTTLPPTKVSLNIMREIPDLRRDQMRLTE